MSTFSPPPARTSPLARVRLDDLAPFDGASTPAYASAVDAIAESLARHGAAALELPAADAAIVRCGLESARAFFRPRPGLYVYRAGRPLDDGELSPACMVDAFRCLGKAARAALSAIARSLRLRSDAFSHLLDDNPLPLNAVSASELLVSFSHGHLQSGQAPIAGLCSSMPEVDRGFVTLVASDHPGIEVYNPNGHWYLADGASGPRDLLLLTGRALSHVTAGLRQNSQYRTTNIKNRASLMFRLMPHANAILDCSPISAAGRCIPQIYQPISASQFMDGLRAEEHIVSHHSEAPSESQGNFVNEPSLRSVLSDPLSGAFLEDAMVLSCGHSFGGLMLKKVLEMARCSICNGEVDAASLFPNFALRAVATVVKMEDDRRLFHNAALRKRRKEVDAQKRNSSSKENGEVGLDAESSRACKGVQYPFMVGERVLIMGNKRTPDKFVGKEAVITSQCLNGCAVGKEEESGLLTSHRLCLCCASVCLMALLGAATSFATPTAPPPPRRRRRAVTFRATASPPALDRHRRPQNVPGEFFVDHRCMDCQTCRWMAPEVFRRVDGKAAVAAQPGSQEERTKALQALLSCPTSSIHTDKPPKDILQVQDMFPLPLDEDLLPGVYLCGYHSEHSFGATSYLVTHPQGNILIDSPRYTPNLADNIERLGGARSMFLTHIDDVADHSKWAERLKCERIIHSGDVEEGTADVEWKLHGNGPWNIGTDFELIHTPGHTPGSVCLHYKPLKVLFTGDHVAKSEESDDLNLFLIYSKQSVSLQLCSIRKLLEVEFEWLLPGHGYRIKYKDVQAKNAAMESLLANYTS